MANSAMSAVRYAPCWRMVSRSSARDSVTTSKRKPATKTIRVSASSCRWRNAWTWSSAPRKKPGSRVPVVSPGVGGVAVATVLPISPLLTGAKLDPVDPLGALPGVELGRDHPHRAAVLSRERPAVRGVDEQHVVLERLLDRQVGGVAV